MDVSSTDGASAQMARVIGNYEIRSLLGKGGMGEVYLVEHPLLHKRAALKVLNQDLCRVAGQVARFQQEAVAVCRIGHPSIVDVFDFGTLPDGRVYYLMEYLEGQNLAEYLDSKGSLSYEETVEILIPVMDALEAAHATGIVHRDLKPENLFLANVAHRRVVKVLDFGIAKLLDTTESLLATATRTGMILGTPAYMAPEQAAGANAKVGPATDIYGLAVVLYEMLTGRPPFVADSQIEVLMHHLKTPAPALALSVAKVADALDPVVRKALAKEPGDRYQSMAQFSAALHSAVDRVRSTLNSAGAGPFQSGSAAAAGVALGATAPSSCGPAGIGQFAATGAAVGQGARGPVSSGMSVTGPGSQAGAAAALGHGATSPSGVALSGPGGQTPASSQVGPAGGVAAPPATGLASGTGVVGVVVPAMPSPLIDGATPVASTFAAEVRQRGRTPIWAKLVLWIASLLVGAGVIVAVTAIYFWGQHRQGPVGSDREARLENANAVQVGAMSSGSTAASGTAAAGSNESGRDGTRSGAANGQGGGAHGSSVSSVRASGARAVSVPRSRARGTSQRPRSQRSAGRGRRRARSREAGTRKSGSLGASMGAGPSRPRAGTNPSMSNGAGPGSAHLSRGEQRLTKVPKMRRVLTQADQLARAGRYREASDKYMEYRRLSGNSNMLKPALENACRAQSKGRARRIWQTITRVFSNRELHTVQVFCAQRGVMLK